MSALGVYLEEEMISEKSAMVKRKVFEYRRVLDLEMLPNNSPPEQRFIRLLTVGNVNNVLW